MRPTNVTRIVSAGKAPPDSAALLQASTPGHLRCLFGPGGNSTAERCADLRDDLRAAAPPDGEPYRPNDRFFTDSSGPMTSLAPFVLGATPAGQVIVPAGADPFTIGYFAQLNTLSSGLPVTRASIALTADGAAGAAVSMTLIGTGAMVPTAIVRDGGRFRLSGLARALHLAWGLAPASGRGGAVGAARWAPDEAGYLGGSAIQVFHGGRGFRPITNSAPTRAGCSARTSATSPARARACRPSPATTAPGSRPAAGRRCSSARRNGPRSSMATRCSVARSCRARTARSIPPDPRSGGVQPDRVAVRPAPGRHEPVHAERRDGRAARPPPRARRAQTRRAPPRRRARPPPHPLSPSPCARPGPPSPGSPSPRSRPGTHRPGRRTRGCASGRSTAPVRSSPTPAPPRRRPCWASPPTGTRRHRGPLPAAGVARVQAVVDGRVVAQLDRGRAPSVALTTTSASIGRSGIVPLRISGVGTRRRPAHDDRPGLGGRRRHVDHARDRRRSRRHPPRRGRPPAQPRGRRPAPGDGRRRVRPRDGHDRAADVRGATPTVRISTPAPHAPPRGRRDRDGHDPQRHRRHRPLELTAPPGGLRDDAGTRAAPRRPSPPHGHARQLPARRRSPSPCARGPH